MKDSILDIRFLENLQQRLQISNRRSIYLNALPGRYLTRLELGSLNQIEAGLANTFLNNLLGKATSSTKIRLSPKKLQDPTIKQLQRRLNSMIIENKDHFDEHGVQTFGFGFPILVRRDQKDPEKIIKAPLFVWSLDISRNWRKANEWELKRGDDYSVLSNTSLAAHLFKDANLKLDPLYSHLMDDGLLDKDELAMMASKQFNQLLFESKGNLAETFRKMLDEEIQTIPDWESIKKMELKEPQLIWSGVFGLYRSQKESIAQDVEDFSQNFDQIQAKIQQLETQKPDDKNSFMKHTFSLVETDPSQQHLLHALGRGENLIIQGPPGTGKSQSLTSIITNAISNGGRCLVVCEKKTAMEVLYNNLKELGLDELSIVVEDVYRDRRALVSSARERMQQQTANYKVSPNFIRILQSCAMQVGRLQKYHNKLLHPISGQDKWSDIVAEYIHSQEKYPKEKIEQHLQARDFSFKSEEYEDIVRILEEGQPLFNELGTLQHPFNAFHERFFEVANTHQVSNELKKSVEDLLYVLDSAQRDLLAYLYEYEKMLEDHYSNVMAKKSRLVDEIVDVIENGFKKSKYFFNKNKGAYRNFLTKISKKHRELAEDKKEVLKNYVLLRNFHERYNYFQHTFIDIKNIAKITFQQIKKNTEEYEQIMSEWYYEKDPAIQQYVNKMSVQYLHPHVDFKKKAKDITRNLDLFVHNFKNSNVFRVPFGFNTTVVRRRLDDLEQLDENLKKLAENFEEEFAAYHPLKYFYGNLSATQRAAFQGLAAANPDNWLGHFKSWYLYHLLNAHADENVPFENHYRALLTNFEREQGEMQAALKKHTLRYWRSEQSKAVKRFNKEKAPVKVHSIYNLRGNTGGRRTPLRKVFEADPELFTAFFPVLMVSPEVCASMLPLQPQLFDLVIFDEASQLRLEDTFGALMRGAYKVVSGDSQQMPPSDYFQTSKPIVRQDEELLDDMHDLDLDALQLKQDAIDYLSSSESLLEYAIADGNYTEEFLQVHYRSQHPALIEFSNAAFYGRRLTPMPAKEEYQPIHFHAINGKYEDGINQEEALAVLNQLIELVNSSEELPSVGIASFNMHQRNYIIELLQEKCIEDHKLAGKIEQLYDNGLFIKNLENIQGDERDYIFISTTFGPDEAGNFIQNFGPLNRQRGYRLLNVMITRARRELHVFTSIPKENYQQYRLLIMDKGNNGKGILYAYLAYAEAVSLGNNQQCEAILNLLYEHCLFKPFQKVNKVGEPLQGFGALVRDFLANELGEGFELEDNARFAGFGIPLRVSAPGGASVAVFFDLFNEFFSEEAYAWDLFYERNLQAMGIPVIRVWSYSWWRDKADEQNRLLQFIKKELG